MTLQEILYKIGVKKRYEYINDLLETPQVKGLIGVAVNRLKYNKQEGYELAASIIKEIMLKNYVYQEKYTEQKFVKYMQRILFDRIRDVLKKEAGYNIVSSSETCNDPFEDIEQKIDLRNALHDLNETEKEVIINYYFLNKTDQEISKKIGMPKSTVFVCRQRALKSLLKNLTKT